MNWRNIRIGGKLGIGFGILIVIAVALGIMAIVNMTSMRTETGYLSDEYLPEIEVSNGMENSFLEAIFELRAYNYTHESNFLTAGKDLLRQTRTHIDQAYDLADKATRLEKLEGATKTVDENLAKYESLLDQTIEVVGKMEQNRNNMDAAAATYMRNCMEYLDGQNARMRREINTGNTNIARLEKITLINNIIDAGNAVRVENFKAQATRDPEALRVAVDEFNNSFAYFDDIRKYTKLQDDLDALDNIEEAGKQYATAINNYLVNWTENERLGDERVPAAGQVTQNANSAAVAALNGTESIAGDIVSLIATSNQVMIVGLIFAMILGVVLALIITKSITTGIGKGVGFAREIAKGDLTAEIEDKYLNQKDEIGQLGNALQSMADKLKQIVQDVFEGSENIASASQELSSTSQQMSQGSSEQASSAEEVSSSMEEMASNIQQNTDNAKQTEKISIKASDDISQGNDAVEKTVGSMKDIAEKITIISEIARQTNILALNAAVEAARAGEHGKGFAVVAEEVRKLAARSQESAQEIDETSKSSVSIAENSGKLLSEIVPDIQKTAKLVQEISAASSEQSSGAEQVNSAIQQLNQVTQQNAAAAEEMATSSEELSSQAEQMRETMEFFNIGSDAKKRTQKKHKKAKTKVETMQQNKEQPQKHQGSTETKGVNLNLNDDEHSDKDFENF
ncbi:MAG TPA: methyl-accepting chemotaxis protein [Salinivirga sp.]|uniref:HAMP domain-containing methyl-accepting chemotaxis protein n=1 Tax=Salinivirga sp. TaxID=1970192 RepID=UPI002B46C7CE|nr:methyl-accepting chemotaxis protein [Salinivirga sp.]HKK59018.1 methyl-accepting chemotaxis protein [Salinivirga sp.]